MEQDSYLCEILVVFSLETLTLQKCVTINESTEVDFYNLKKKMSVPSQNGSSERFLERF